MLHKKRKSEKSKAANPQDAPLTAASDAPLAPGLDAAIPQHAPPAIPSAPAAAFAPRSRPVAQAGPGRPATRPHCMRCAKRIERCRCKEGVLLPGQVQRAVEDAKKRETLPLSSDEAEQILRFLCWGLGIAESAAAALITKLSWDEAEEIYSFTEADVAALLPPAHKVLAKYAAKLPAWLRDYRDEMALGIAFYSVQKQKAAAATELLDRKAAVKPTRPQLVPAAEDHAKAQGAGA